MATSLENQYIDESYQKVTQISGSILADGTGSAITDLDLTASHAVSASYAVSASVEIIKEVSSSYADVAGFADGVSGSNVVGTVSDATNATTALSATSASYATIARYAEDADRAGQVNVVSQTGWKYIISAGGTGVATLVANTPLINAGLNAISASSFTGSFKGDLDGNAATATSASYAATASLLLGSIASASFAASASHAEYADIANASNTATSASHAISANNSITATSASYAVSASHAENSGDWNGQFDGHAGITGSLTVNDDLIVEGTDPKITLNSATHTGSLQEDRFLFTDTNTGLVTNQFSANAYLLGSQSRSTFGISDAFVTLTSTETGLTSAIDTEWGLKFKTDGVSLPSNMLVVDSSTGLMNTQLALSSSNSISASAFKGDGTNITGVVSASRAISAASADTATTATTATSASHAVQADSSLTAISSSHAVASDTSISASHAIIANSALTATSSSHAINADTASFLPSSTRLNITDITASNATFTSASIGYLKTVTGSATIIGDEYIILNSDSPVQRYAGVKVYDSGSGLTGSFEWDSVDDNWMQVATDGTSAGFLTGISGSKGSEAYPSNNTIVKGTGNHTVKDSSIVDDGTKVSTTLPISASAGVTASLHGNADTATLATNATNAVSASHAVQADSATSASHALNADSSISSSFATTASYASNADNWDGIFTGSASMTGSLTVDGDTLLNYKTAPNFARKDIVTFPAFTKSASPGNGLTYNYNAFNYFNIPVAGAVNNVFQIAQGSDSDITDYGAYLNVGGARSEIFLLASGSDSDAKRTATIAVLDDGDLTYEGNSVARYYGTTIEIGQYNSRDIQIGNGMNGGSGYDTRTIQTSAENMYIGAAPGLSFAWKDDVNYYTGNPTKDIEFWYTGSATFHQTSSVVSPAVVISGSVASHVQDLTIASTTASIDCNIGDIFTLTLANNANTHLVATNINPGQVITVKVKNNATAAGTLSFNSEFAFAEGTAPTVTATTNAEDIITFQSFDSSKLYGTSVLNLS